MSTLQTPNTEIESGGGRRRRQRRPSNAVGSETTTTTTDGSLCFSDSEDISVNHSLRDPTVSDSYSDVDLESGVKVHEDKEEERDCRICHLKLMRESGSQEVGVAIELGCSCKGDLGSAHKQCAETWFKIKGNRTCEICGGTALNVVGDRTNEANSAATANASAAPALQLILVTEPQRFWHGRRVMNFLLGCMVLAFAISWLFHFHVLS